MTHVPVAGVPNLVIPAYPFFGDSFSLSTDSASAISAPPTFALLTLDFFLNSPYLAFSSPLVPTISDRHSMNLRDPAINSPALIVSRAQFNFTESQEARVEAESVTFSLNSDASTPVVEPSVLSLFGVSLLGLIGNSRRFRSR